MATSASLTNALSLFWLDRRRDHLRRTFLMLWSGHIPYRKMEHKISNQIKLSHCTKPVHGTQALLLRMVPANDKYVSYQNHGNDNNTLRRPESKSQAYFRYVQRYPVQNPDKWNPQGCPKVWTNNFWYTKYVSHWTHCRTYFYHFLPR